MPDKRIPLRTFAKICNGNESSQRIMVLPILRQAATFASAGSLPFQWSIVRDQARSRSWHPDLAGESGSLQSISITLAVSMAS